MANVQEEVIVALVDQRAARDLEEAPQSLDDHHPKHTNQLVPISGTANKFGSDTIAAKLSNLQMSDNEDAGSRGVALAAEPVITSDSLSVVADCSDDFVQHNNSVCVDDDSDLLAIVSEATIDACNQEYSDDEEEEDGDVVSDPPLTTVRQSRKSEGDGGSQSGPTLPVAKRVHNSKSMCDNDLLVDHLINKKDSMRIRFADNGDALIQKRNILHRKFYKSVDDELHKKAVASMGGKSQCMTLDRVFKKLRGQIRKCGEGTLGTVCGQQLVSSILIPFSPSVLAGKDGSKVTIVVATPGQGPDRPQEISYTDPKVIGNGSFGVVFEAKLCETGELVAIKKVLQDKRFKVSGGGG